MIKRLILALSLASILGAGSAAAQVDDSPKAGAAALERRIMELEAQTATTALDGRRADEDLAAQKSMATSAREMLAPTWIGAGVALVSGLGLLITLALTMWSLLISRRALQLTRQQVLDQMDTNRKQLRAFVHVTDMRLEDVSRGKTPRAFVEMKNMGATPARSVRTSLAVRFEYESGAQRDFSRMPAYSGFALAPGAKGGASRRLSHPLSSRQWRDLRARNFETVASITVSGEIKYLDIFDREWTIEFASYFFRENGKLKGMKCEDRNWAD